MRPGLLLLFFAVLAACGGTDSSGGTDGAGEGTVTVTAYGESFIEDGIPASEVGDGWAVSFSRFEVNIADVRVAGVELAAPGAIDLSAPSSGEGHELGSVLAPTGEHSGASFTITRVEVEGEASRGADSQSFNWVFDEGTRYTDCETTTSVSDGGSATFQITVHVDHLLYDSLVAEEPQVLFQALADADADADGTLTQAELAATDIGAYDPGSADGVDDLWTWLAAQTRTLGHVDGEGHCSATPAN